MKQLSILPILTLALLFAAGCDRAPAPVDADVQALLSEGRNDEAVTMLGSKLESGSLTAREWSLLGEARARQGELPKAELALRDGLEQFPGDLQLSLALSQLYQNLGQLSRARTTLEGAAAMGQSRSEYWLELGVLQGRSGELDQAEASFEKAAGLGAAVADVEFNLGVVEQGRGDIEAAADHFRAALAADPERTSTQRQLASTILTAPASSVEERQEASAILEGVVDADPEDWRAWSLLGDAQLSFDDPHAAVVYYTYALKFSQNESSVEAKYVEAARAAKALDAELGISDPNQEESRPGPPIPASIQERAKAARRAAQEANASAKDVDKTVQ